MITALKALVFGMTLVHSDTSTQLASSARSLKPLRAKFTVLVTPQPCSLLFSEEPLLPRLPTMEVYFSGPAILISPVNTIAFPRTWPRHSMSPYSNYSLRGSPHVHRNSYPQAFTTRTYGRTEDHYNRRVFDVMWTDLKMWTEIIKI